MPGDALDTFVQEYAADVIQPGAILFVTEKIVAITQGRSYLVEDIQLRRLALSRSRFVVRTPSGHRLGMPETQWREMGQCGVQRHRFAASVSCVVTTFGRQ